MAVLTTSPVAAPAWRYDPAQGQRVGGLGAVVGPHDVQAQVDAGGGAGRGEDVAVVDEQLARVDMDGRVALGEGGRVHPVGGGGAPVEQSGGGQHEGPGAQADDPGGLLVGPPPRATA